MANIDPARSLERTADADAPISDDLPLHGVGSGYDLAGNPLPAVDDVPAVRNGVPPGVKAIEHHGQHAKPLLPRAQDNLEPLSPMNTHAEDQPLYDLAGNPLPSQEKSPPEISPLVNPRGAMPVKQEMRSQTLPTPAQASIMKLISPGSGAPKEVQYDLAGNPLPFQDTGVLEAQPIAAAQGAMPMRRDLGGRPVTAPMHQNAITAPISASTDDGMQYDLAGNPLPVAEMQAPAHLSPALAAQSYSPPVMPPAPRPRPAPHIPAPSVPHAPAARVSTPPAPPAPDRRPHPAVIASMANSTRVPGVMILGSVIILTFLITVAILHGRPSRLVTMEGALPGSSRSISIPTIP